MSVRSVRFIIGKGRNSKLSGIKFIKEVCGIGLKDAKDITDSEWGNEFIDLESSLSDRDLQDLSDKYEKNVGFKLELKHLHREARLAELLDSEKSQKFIIIGNKAIYGVSEGHYNIDEDKGIVNVTIQSGYREFQNKKVEIENRKIILSFTNCIIEEKL
ncbi:MAG: hypothetical protein SLAVMIC_00854 [uncultured marine phage]|uniref:Uncharacterized protein n=1 Tax=uncultured marine phage TaxID=707152 RepID=A0A8D9FRW4_9VIRU|nr:MAG: hypothetical protein SLAVMIC_00854 [uncultured marine phage]